MPKKTKDVELKGGDLRRYLQTDESGNVTIQSRELQQFVQQETAPDRIGAQADAAAITVTIGVDF